MTDKAAKRWKEPLARYVGTLVYVDEPQVILLEHGIDSKIIALAIEKDGYDHPFLGAEISLSQWQRYKREFVDLRYLFLQPRWNRWYLFDLQKLNKDKLVPITRAERTDYKNEEYLPSHGFFSRDHTETLEEIIATDFATQKYLIDGTWEPVDLSIFFGRINDLYAFFLGIEKFRSETTTREQKRNLVETFTQHPMRGGSSYINFYGDLKGLLGFEERLSMGSIVKQSPGFVDLQGRSDILSEIVGAYDFYLENQEQLKDQYNALRGYLSKSKFLKLAPEKFDKTGPAAKHIRGMCNDFSRSLGVDNQAIDRLTGNHPLMIAKILLSYHRRMERYFLFFAEGRVKFPEDT